MEDGKGKNDLAACFLGVREARGAGAFLLEFPRPLLCLRPSLRLSGRGDRFEIRALDRQGERDLDVLEKRLAFCDALAPERGTIKGVLAPRRGDGSEEQRLKARTHFDLFREVHRLLGAGAGGAPAGGLFGAFGYDLVDQMEELPPDRIDPLGDPDYELVLADHALYGGPAGGEPVFAAAFRERGESEIRELRELYREALEPARRAETAVSGPGRNARTEVSNADRPMTTESFEPFRDRVLRFQEHIRAGDVFQAQVSREASLPAGDPMAIYAALRRANPSPYSFFLSLSRGALFGCSPELAIRVSAPQAGRRRVELRPIAGTKARGRVARRGGAPSYARPRAALSEHGPDSGDEIDVELDARYEAELRSDPKELAEHTMLVDLARNDLARICVPGTRRVSEPFRMEKYSHVQHLVSVVEGDLRDDLDPLHAYAAAMNMGTLTGAPKVEAMKLIRRYEPTRRGFFGGGVGGLHADGELETGIAIRGVRWIDGRAHLRAGAGVVLGSVPEGEYAETGAKLEACVQAIKGVPL